ncbi:MAG TPA: High molecular weight rubredoxin [Thermoplasmata archaeon]|nr:High molecular weight rubredoxin [Thermoplasmata archaeon]
MDPKTFHKVSYGLYVVSSKMGEKFNGQIANTVTQVTSDPPKIAVVINKQNLTSDFIRESNVFTVSILSKTSPMKFIGHFGFKSGRELDKFEGMGYKVGVTGAPIITENTIAYLEAEVVDSLDVGTHTIFIGKVVEAEIVGEYKEPMTCAYYHEVKRGKLPKSAPTYIKEEVKEIKEVVKMDKYVCLVCGYVYDPEKGDPDSGIKSGTPFEELPEDWVCPICGAGKDEFKKEE